MERVNAFVAHETPEYKFELEERRNEQGQTMLLAHLSFTRWSVGALKRCMRDWKLFRQHVTVPLFASPKVYDKRWEKFVTLMGWKPFTTVLCNDGVERPLYIHTV